MKRRHLTGAVVTAVAVANAAAAAEPRATAAERLDAIADGFFSAEANVRRAIDAIAAWTELNAVARLDAERALEAARAVDEGRRTGPLAGLVLVVKDNIQVEGLPAAAGTPALQSVVSDRNAPIVQTLVDAGAIIVATTNMHELAFGISGYNPTYQTGSGVGVRNPYDTARFAGGSSSGTAALVGAGAVSAGLGTDTGGSVRVPAAVNGVAGLRPTIGRYPAAGIVPISSTRDTPGFIAASVGDIELLDRVVTGAAPAGAADLPGLRLGVAPAFSQDLGPEVEAVWADTLSRLEAAGVELVDVDVSEIVRRNAEVSFPIALYEANVDLRAYLARHAPGIGIEEVVAGIRSPDVKSTYETFVLPGKLPAPDGTLVEAEPVYRSAMDESRPALIAAYEKLFAEADVEALVFPTVPKVAVVADADSSSLETFTTFIRNTDPASNAGLPGLTLPAGLGAGTGLPVGVELDGPAGSDRRLLEIGMALEGLFGTLPLPEAP